MLVSRSDNCAALTRFFIDGPACLVSLATDLHQPLILVPTANGPNRIIRRQLIFDVGVARAKVEAIANTRRREHKEQSAEAKRRLHAEVAIPGYAESIESVDDGLLVTRRPAPC